MGCELVLLGLHEAPPARSLAAEATARHLAEVLDAHHMDLVKLARAGPAAPRQGGRSTSLGSSKTQHSRWLMMKFSVEESIAESKVEQGSLMPWSRSFSM
mmetsp:Transcript_62510/g.201618  ORF Transcript_62510/g.201618 Transcript_62510/m.201618 type:complete len:100 (-) Transcript_62510:28-327(-)